VADGTQEAHFTSQRRSYHALLRDKVLRLEDGVPSNADMGNTASKAIALGIFKRIGLETSGPLRAKTAGREFEMATAAFLRETFGKLSHLRPGDWIVQRIGEEERDHDPKKKEEVRDFEKLIKIARFEQYAHLIAIAKAAGENAELAASLGIDYIVEPDMVIYRDLVDDDEINQNELLVDNTVALMSSLRKKNTGSPLLHAAVSCTLTINNDLSQDLRSEATELIRNRRGKLPHLVVVTAEPLPSRLASVALGSSGIDCVYHFALPELRETVRVLGLADSEESLNIMVNGKRLKDISDLPLDLAV